MSTYQCMVRGRWHRGAGVGTGWEGVFGVAGDDSSDRDGGDICARSNGESHPRLNLKAHGLGRMDLTASTMITHTDLLQHRDDFGVVQTFGITESCRVHLPPRGECM